MFKELAMRAMISAIQALLCSFLGYCEDEASGRDDCPDGICGDAMSAVDSLGDDAQTPVMSPGRTQAFAGTICWDCLPVLMDAVKQLADALKKFLGKTPSDHSNVVG